MKKSKMNRQAHTANTKYGSGDFYGTAIKQKMGRSRENSIDFSSNISKKLKVPPKSLA